MGMLQDRAQMLACLAGSLVMTVFGTAFNGVYLLPAFSKLFGMPLEAIIAAGAEINGNINPSPSARPEHGHASRSGSKAYK